MGATASQPRGASRLKQKPKFMLTSDKDYIAIPPDIECGEDASQRIASVVPFLTKHCGQFWANLRPRERDHFEVTDLLQTMWEVLLEKDHYFDRKRGTYITFIDPIIHQQLASIRNRCHIVTSPRDTADRLKNPARQKTAILVSIKQAISDVNSLDELRLEDHLTEDVTVLATIENDERAICCRRVQRALEFLTNPRHIIVLGLKYGLNSHLPHSDQEIAIKLECTTMEAMKLASEAEAAMARIVNERYDSL
jgi:hypothetical protein